MLQINFNFLDKTETVVIHSETINVDDNKSISSLKQIISNRFEENVLSIKFNGVILENDRNLKSYGVKNYSEVVIITDVEEICLNVEVSAANPRFKAIQVKCRPDTTTEKLVQIICKKAPFDTKSSYLTFGGETLQSGQTLQQQNIKNHDVIHVAMKMRGG